MVFNVVAVVCLSEVVCNVSVVVSMLLCLFGSARLCVNCGLVFQYLVWVCLSKIVWECLVVLFNVVVCVFVC